MPAQSVSLYSISFFLRPAQAFRVIASFVDQYQDIQTAAFICSYYKLIAKDAPEQVNAWIEVYRNFLNNLRLWNVRA